MNETIAIKLDFSDFDQIVRVVCRCTDCRFHARDSLSCTLKVIQIRPPNAGCASYEPRKNLPAPKIDE